MILVTLSLLYTWQRCKIRRFVVVPEPPVAVQAVPAVPAVPQTYLKWQVRALCPPPVSPLESVLFPRALFIPSEPNIQLTAPILHSPGDCETSRHFRAHDVCISISLDQLAVSPAQPIVRASPTRGRPSEGPEGPRLQRVYWRFGEQTRLDCNCFQRRQALPTQTLTAFCLRTQPTIYGASATTAERQLPMFEFHPEPPVKNAYTVPQDSIPVLGLVRGRSRQQITCNQRSFLQIDIDVVSMTRIHLESAASTISSTSTILTTRTPLTLPSPKRQESAESGESNSQKPKIPNAVQTPPILQTPAERPRRYNVTPRKRHFEATTKSSRLRTRGNIRERAFYMPSLRMPEAEYDG